MKVLVVGSEASGTVSCFFVNALKSLGYDYELVESEYPHHRKSIIRRLTSRLIGGRPLTYWKTNREVMRKAERYKPQVILIPKGAWISPVTLEELRQITDAVLINFATDDPFNPVVSTRKLVQGIPHYDLYVSTKRAIIEDLRRAGAKDVIFCPFGYDPQTHFPEQPKNDLETRSFQSDVVFVGGADLDRRATIHYLADRLARSQTLCLYGGFWNRDPVLHRYYRGFAVDREYRLALCGAKIALGFVRKANRDGHAMRAFEIPACGTFMLAERTEEHQEFFEEGRHIGYFQSDEELVDKVAFYLDRPSERERMSRACYERVRQGKHTYLDRLIQIFKHAMPI